MTVRRRKRSGPGRGADVAADGVDVAMRGVVTGIYGRDRDRNRENQGTGPKSWDGK